MDRRLKLQTLLSSIPGVQKVYYSPPQNIQMVFPCIVYSRSDSYTDSADNQAYRRKKRWSVTVIDRNIDSMIPDLVENLRYARFDRYQVVDGLHHNYFNLYF